MKIILYKILRKILTYAQGTKEDLDYETYIFLEAKKVHSKGLVHWRYY